MGSEDLFERVPEHEESRLAGGDRIELRGGAVGNLKRHKAFPFAIKGRYVYDDAAAVRQCTDS